MLSGKKNILFGDIDETLRDVGVIKYTRFLITDTDVIYIQITLKTDLVCTTNQIIKR